MHLKPDYFKLFWKKVFLKEDYQRSSKNITIFVFEPSLLLWKSSYETQEGAGTSYQSLFYVARYVEKLFFNKSAMAVFNVLIQRGF